MANAIPLPSDFAWSELLKVGLSGMFNSLIVGIGAAILARLIPWNTAKAKVAPDPLDDGI